MRTQKPDVYEALNADLFKHPEIPSKVKVWRHQWIGIPVLLTLPLLGIFGFFDKNMMTNTVQQNGVKAIIEYPTKLRYGEEEHLRIAIKNESAQELKNVSASMSREYLETFDDVAFTPDVNGHYNVQLETISPGETRYIDIKLKGGEYGSNEGQLVLHNEGQSIVNQNLKTFVFP